jgi:hypothetical protein
VRPSVVLAESRGSVILESAIVIPLIISVGIGMLGVLSIGVAMLSVGDIARGAARELARGVPQHSVIETAQLAVPNGEVVIHRGSDLVTVSVSRRMQLPMLSWEPFGITIERSASAAVEQP